MAEMSAIGKPVAFDASADEREVRGLISMMMSRSDTGSCAHCTFVPPTTCTASTMRCDFSSRRLITSSEMVCMGAAQNESPV